MKITNMISKLFYNTQVQKTSLKAFPYVAAMSPKISRCLVRMVVSNPKFLEIMKRKRLVRRLGRSLLKSRPLLAQVHVTSYCNHRCPMCNIWKYPAMMTYEDVIRTVDICADMGVAILSLTGGEALLHPQLPEIITYASKKQFYIHFNTNGTLPLKYFERIANSDIDSVIFSFHSLDPQTHESVTGSNTNLSQLKCNIEYLKKRSRIHIILNCVVTAHNISEIDDIISYAKDNDLVCQFHPVMVSPKDRETATTNESLVAKKMDLLTVIDKAEEYRRSGGMLSETSGFYDHCRKSIETGSSMWPCKAGERFFTVSPDCRFGICQDFPTALKITDKQFMQIWKSDPFRAKMKSMRAECAGCHWACYHSLETFQNLIRDPPLENLSIPNNF